jgi:predicted peptidase
MRCCIGWVVAIAISASTAAEEAQLSSEAFRPAIFQVPNDGMLRYRLSAPPAIEGTDSAPLVVFLHGAGQRGEDNVSQLEHGALDIHRFSQQQDSPAFILAAQVSAEEQWVDTPWSDDTHRISEQPSRSMRLLMALIDNVIDEAPIDKHRVYLVGLSMGGFGVWDLLARRPQFFAAAIPVCGGGDIATANVIKGTPIWAFHGADDVVVKPRRSRDMVRALRAVGGQPKYTEYEDVGHDAWTLAFADPEVMAWMFSQSL